VTFCPEDGSSRFLRNVNIYSKTSLIRTNWERTLVQINDSPSCISATENMLREAIKCKNVDFDISPKHIIGSGNVIIKVVMRKKKVVRVIANSELLRFHCITRLHLERP
jgi:hypothetical protein